METFEKREKEVWGVGGRVEKSQVKGVEGEGGESYWKVKSRIASFKSGI